MRDNQNIKLTLFELSISNFATFENQTIHFHNQFNSIIGETGSGKSLVLDAIELILGHRADKKLIRKDKDFAIVEATFTFHSKIIKDYLDEIGFPSAQDEVVIKRIIYQNGKSKAYLNMQQCNLAELCKFTRSFVDLVGQFENQKLLSSQYQIQLLDQFSNHERMLQEYRSSYNALISNQKDLVELKERAKNNSQRLDYINFQINEIEKVNPSIDDEAKHLKVKDSFQKSLDSQESIATITSLLNGDDQNLGAISLIKKIQKLNLENILSEKQLNDLAQASEILNDLSYALETGSENSLDFEQYEEALDQLDKYQKLKRKFHTNTEGLVEIYNNFIQERDEYQSLDSLISKKISTIKKLENESLELSLKLHESRIKNAKLLSKSLTSEIQALNMTGAIIDLKLSKNEELNIYGQSQLHFMVQTNPGEGFHEIKDIASGGELSRVLLTLRKVLRTKDSISVFLFDEIDSGIGGETALKIGEALNAIALNSQVIAITHLPQIANQSQKLIVVNKELIKNQKDTRTISNIVEVKKESFEQYIKQMSPLN